MISRRGFIGFTAAALATTRLADAFDGAPGMLDHILLGNGDLDRGVAFVESRTGVKAMFGGVHPGMGTRNALLSLGKRRYLEIIAPDPKQENADARRVNELRKLETPKLVGWAAHPGRLDLFVQRIKQQGIAIEGPSPGSRARPDGRILKWKTAVLKDDRGGLVPFFIEWEEGSVHPSSDAPGGCRLESFSIAGPDPDALAAEFHKLNIEVAVTRGDKPQLRATIAGPKGVMEVTS
jgi:hypothetical protein